MRILFLSLLLTACLAPTGSDLKDTSSRDTTAPLGDVSIPAPTRWTQHTGPCSGSTTGALLFDDRNTGYAGCGENANGERLLYTTDGGRSWTGLEAFAEVRINDLRRGPDGILYGAGIHNVSGSTSAWRLEGEPLTLTPLFQPGPRADAVRQAENVARTANGQFLVDSLTGTTAAHLSAEGELTEMYALDEATLTDPEAPGYQVRRVVAFDNRFWAVGSVINDPATVRLPSTEPGATYHMRSLPLQEPDEDGELLDMHIWSATRMIAAGYDQGAQRPLVFVANGDPYRRESWTRVSIDIPAGIEALHVVGNTVYAVGERVPTAAGGLLLRSVDGGLTWEDITPTGAGPFSEVWAFEDGTLVASGGGYTLWIGTP